MKRPPPAGNPMRQLPAEVIARIDRLELEARQVVEGYLSGRHRSPRHGFAVEFAQHREYAPGDDIRHIDWKVYARTERYHLKQYEQETNLVAWLVVDASESMKVGTVAKPDGTRVGPDRLREGSDTRIVTKFDAACILAAAMAHLIVGQTDSAGLVVVTDRPRVVVKPSAQPGQVREILRGLGDAPSDCVSSAGKALRDLGGVLGRRGLVFAFGDFLDDAADLVTGMRILRSQKHELSLFQVLDAAEVDFPFRHPTIFRGLEQLPEIATDPLGVRDSYLAEFGKHIAEVEAACRSLEADYTRVRTDDDFGRVLAGYLQRRKGR